MSVQVFDDRKRLLTFSRPPTRIVSLVPSDTYSLAALGASSFLVGRTDYCVLPEDVAERVPSIGGTKNPRIDDVIALEPDLVIANQEENTRTDLERLAQQGIRMLIVFPKRAADALSGLARLARILGVEKESSVRQLLAKGYASLRDETCREGSDRVRVFCPIWMDPLMTVHRSTFIGSVLETAGAENVFADRTRRYPLAADRGQAPAWTGEQVAERDVRYPRVTEAELLEAAPEVILLPDEPHPFSGDDEAAFRRMFERSAKTPYIVHVSGKDLCWYGAWTVDALPRVRRVIDEVRNRARPS